MKKIKTKKRRKEREGRDDGEKKYCDGRRERSRKGE